MVPKKGLKLDRKRWSYQIQGLTGTRADRDKAEQKRSILSLLLPVVRLTKPSSTNPCAHPVSDAEPQIKRTSTDQASKPCAYPASNARSDANPDPCPHAGPDAGPDAGPHSCPHTIADLLSHASADAAAITSADGASDVRTDTTANHPGKSQLPTMSFGTHSFACHKPSTASEPLFDFVRILIFSSSLFFVLTHLCQLAA